MTEARTINGAVAASGGRDAVGVAVAVALSAAYAAIALVRRENLWAGGLDLGLFDQAVWMMSEWRSPDVTFVGGNIFADHVSPVLLLFVPLYWIAATPVWLLVGQAIALGSTVVPMRALARTLGAPVGVVTGLVVGSAPLLAAATFDMHPLAMATPGIAVALLGTIRDDTKTAVAGIGWAAFCRTDTAFVALGLCILASARLRKWLVGIAVVPLVATLVVPELFGGARQTFDRYYADLGDTPIDALTHPWRVFIALADPSVLETAIIWLLPVGLLPLLRPRWLAMLALAGAPVLLSSWPGVSLPWFHNASYVAPLAIGAAAASLASRPNGTGDPDPPEQRTRQVQSIDSRRAGAVALVGAAAALGVMSPLAPRAPSSIRLATIIDRNGPDALPALLAGIPDDVSVAASNQLAPPLAHRDEIVVLPCPFERLLDDPDADPALVDVCSGRGSYPDVVVARTRDASALQAIGYTIVRDDVTGVVLAELAAENR